MEMAKFSWNLANSEHALKGNEKKNLPKLCGDRVYVTAATKDHRQRESIAPEYLKCTHGPFPSRQDYIIK